MSKVKLNKVIKEYDKIRAIHGIDLEIDQGEFCVFVGPSGCGKSTLLRMIAGLEEVSDGNIFIGNRNVTKVDAAERGIAMVFQTYALYPHMTVEQNIGFGLKMSGMPKQEVKSKVDEVARILQLGAYMTRKPKALSGGQRQRVAIGRALVRGPEVFLFDEPLSNLDAELRVDMRVEIARLHQEIGATMVYVTHDQVEAMTLADKIVVLREGKIEQVGSPMQLYEDPDNKFVAGFIGSPAMNFVTAEVKEKRVSSKLLASQKIGAPAAANGKIVMGIRPEHITICPKEKTLKIDMIEKLGGVTYVYASSSSKDKLIIELKGVTDLKRGDHIGVNLDKENLYFFDAKSQQRIR